MAEITKFSKEVIDYIIANENRDPYALALNKSPFPGLSMKVISGQISGRKVAKKKFPFLLKINQFRYPKKESLEQASSEQTAMFKSKQLKGDSFADLTGGMGIDTYLIGRNFQSCMYVEPNQDLFNVTTQNFKHLGFSHCECLNMSCEQFLQSTKRKFDWIYMDPSRRVDGNRKTSINNYEPNVLELQKEITKISENVLVKLSPMQDIGECVKELHNVHKIWVISIQNEVKELLLHLKAENDPAPYISAIDINNEGTDVFSYAFKDRTCDVLLGSIKKYIYQPNSAIIKAQLHNRYAKKFELQKLHANTQLYTSDSKEINFAGRVFLVKENIRLSKNEIKRALPLMKANVITKNFPLSPQELVKKYKLKEGGDEYLIAFTDYHNNKNVAICKRLK